MSDRTEAPTSHLTTAPILPEVDVEIVAAACGTDPVIVRRIAWIAEVHLLEVLRFADTAKTSQSGSIDREDSDHE